MFGHMRDTFEERGRCRGEGRGDREAMARMFAMRGGPFRRGSGGDGPGRGRGFGDDGEGGRVGRLLLQGDLKILVLALIEKEPRHGYDIIKHIEELTGGFYAPSPGVIYPTLTYLEEAGHVVAEADGNKKRYAITEEGRAYLGENRSLTDMILGRLSAFVEKLKRRQDWAERGERPRGPELPRSIEAAMLNLREAIARRLKEDERASGDILRQLLDFAEVLERKED